MSDYRKQHPLMILITLIHQLRNWLIPLFVWFLLQIQLGESSGLNVRFFIAPFGFAALAATYSAINWFFYRYKLSDDALNIKSGILIKKRRYIKRARIQTTNQEAGLILRLFNLTSLKVETASSKHETEVYLAALSPDEAARIQKYLSETKTQETNEKPGPKTLVSLSFKTLLLAGITSGGIGVVFSIVGVIFSQALAFIPEAWMALIYDSVLAMSVLYILILAIIVFIFSWLISIVRYLLRFAYFKIETQEDEIIITRGFIVKRTFRLKAHRIQAISLIEGILREPFKLTTIECDVAGGSEYEPKFKITLMPILKHQDIQAFLTKLIPAYAFDFNLEALPKRALKRYLIRANIPYLLLLPLYIYQPLSLLVLTTLPFSLYLGYLRYRNGGFYYDDTHLILRTRLLAKQTHITLRKQLQTIGFSQNPLQRYQRLGTFHFTVLSTPSHQTFTLKDMDLSTLQSTQSWFQKPSKRHL